MSPADLGSKSKDLVLVSEEELELPSGNDLVILEELGDSFEGNASAISFQGIRRKLGLHQETLSRSLHRLERDGLVDKLAQDYKISKKGAEILGRNKDHVQEISFSIPILRTILPPEATEEQVEQALSHRWFGNLRWFGSSQSSEERILSWVTEDGKLKLSARLSDHYLTVESQATTKESMQTAIRAGYEIFDHISKAFKREASQPQKHPLYRAG
ncbi:MAG: hypothetical protein ACYCQJ_08410 [Nitrososphaerales archaeon]